MLFRKPESSSSTLDLTIESKSDFVYLRVRSHIKDNIVNNELTIPLSDGVKTRQEAKAAYFSKFETYYGKHKHPKILISKYWLLAILVVFSALLNEKPYYGAKLAMFLTISIMMMKVYQKAFASLPLQSIGTSYLLNPDEKRQVDLDQRFDKVYVQTERAGPLGYARYFSCDSDLESAMQDRNIPYFEHDAILRCLFSVKNNVYDCISSACLTTLLLIKNKLPANIERVMKTGQSADGHSYDIVNRTQGKIADLSSWNDDAIVIDPWYGIKVTAKQLKEDPSILLRHPLLDPRDKFVVMTIQGNNPPKGYEFYLKKLESLLKYEVDDVENSIQRRISHDCGGTILPRL